MPAFSGILLALAPPQATIGGRLSRTLPQFHCGNLFTRGASARVNDPIEIGLRTMKKKCSCHGAAESLVSRRQLRAPITLWQGRESRERERYLMTCRWDARVLPLRRFFVSFGSFASPRIESTPSDSGFGDVASASEAAGFAETVNANP